MSAPQEYVYMAIVIKALRVMGMVVKLDTPVKVANAQAMIIEVIGTAKTRNVAAGRVARWLDSMGFVPNEYSTEEFNPLLPTKK